MQGGGVQSTSLKFSPYILSMNVTIGQLIPVYLHVYNCLVITIEYTSALHAMTLIGGAAASETLIGRYICTIGGAAPPKAA